MLSGMESSFVYGLGGSPKNSGQATRSHVEISRASSYKFLGRWNNVVSCKGSENAKHRIDGKLLSEIYL